MNKFFLGLASDHRGGAAVLVERWDGGGYAIRSAGQWKQISVEILQERLEEACKTANPNRITVVCKTEKIGKLLNKVAGYSVTVELPKLDRSDGIFFMIDAINSRLVDVSEGSIDSLKRELQELANNFDPEPMLTPMLEALMYSLGEMNGADLGRRQVGGSQTGAPYPDFRNAEKLQKATIPQREFY